MEYNPADRLAHLAERRTNVLEVLASRSDQHTGSKK